MRERPVNREMSLEDSVRKLPEAFLELRDPEFRLVFIKGMKEDEKSKAAELYRNDENFRDSVENIIADCCDRDWEFVAKDIGAAMGASNEDIARIIEASEQRRTRAA